MVQELPTGEMEWSENLKYRRSKENHRLSFVYEVDLKYPKDLRMKTKYFPFYPENIKPKKLHWTKKIFLCDTSY